jgi:hypothetical protein
VVRRYVATNGGDRYAAEDVTGALRVEVLRRSIATWKPAALRARLRLVERLTDTYREQGDDRTLWFSFEASLLRDELRRRPSTPRGRRKARPVCEALPDLRKLGEAHQQRMLDEAAREIEAWRLERTPSAPAAVGAQDAGNTVRPSPSAPLDTPAPVEPDGLDPVRWAYAMGNFAVVHRAAAERGVSYGDLVAMLSGDGRSAVPAAACI